MSAAENEQLQTIVETIKQRLPGGIVSEETTYGDLVLNVDRRQCHDVLRQLRDTGFDFLADIAGVDLLKLEHDDRFQLVYNLYSISKNLRVRVRISVPEDDMNVPSVADIWAAANWAEREAYDMFGFNFEGHPNLARILCHREFEGHALRKDYPVMKGQWAAGSSDLMQDIDKE